MTHPIKIEVKFRVPFEKFYDTVEWAREFMAYVQSKAPQGKQELWHERYGKYGTLYYTTEYESIFAYQEAGGILEPDPKFKELEGRVAEFMMEGDFIEEKFLKKWV